MLDTDIIHLISQYCKLKSLREINKIINLPTKQKRKLKYCKNHLFRCIECNGDLYEYCTTDMNRYPRISHHDEHQKYFYCCSCEYFYRCCQKCSDKNIIVLCQFLGFNGHFFRQGRYIMKIRIIDKSTIDKILDKFPWIASYLNKNALEIYKYDFNVYNYQQFLEIFSIVKEMNLLIKYDVGDLNLEYFDIHNCLINGDRFRSPPLHYWKCINCRTYYVDRPP